MSNHDCDRSDSGTITCHSSMSGAGAAVIPASEPYAAFAERRRKAAQGDTDEHDDDVHSGRSGAMPFGRLGDLDTNSFSVITADTVR